MVKVLGFLKRLRILNCLRMLKPFGTNPNTIGGIWGPFVGIRLLKVVLDTLISTAETLSVPTVLKWSQSVRYLSTYEQNCGCSRGSRIRIRIRRSYSVVHASSSFRTGTIG